MKKKNLKSILGVAILSTALISSYVPAFAAVPAATDTTTITVEGVESGSTVKAYKIVDATYGAEGLTGYAQTTASKAVSVIADLEHPTIANVTDITKAINAGTLSPAELTLTYDSATGNYVSNNAEAGSYIVLVTSENKGVVYNPMYVSNSYTDANDGTTLTDTGSVDADSTIAFTGGRAYAKKQDNITVTKEIVDSSTDDSKVDDAKVGDNVSFKVTTAIPDYSEAYTKAKFTITDTLSAGLGSVSSVVVKVDDDTVTASDDTFTQTIENGVITIDFDSDYVLANPKADIEVTYNAVVTEDAVSGFNPNTNDVEVEYTTLPNVDNNGDTPTGTTDDSTAHYTFKIDELRKTDEAGEDLSGAVFTLTQIADRDGNIAAANQPTWTATSENDGTITFDKLDEGTYTMVETEAPDGYTLNTTVYTIVVTPTYDANHELASYSVAVTPEGGSTATSTHYANGQDTVNGTDIPNTPLASLPSTGGAGTFMLTVIGAVTMTSGVLFIMRKKKPSEENAQ